MSTVRSLVFREHPFPVYVFRSFFRKGVIPGTSGPSGSQGFWTTFPVGPWREGEGCRTRELTDESIRAQVSGRALWTDPPYHLDYTGRNP